MYVIVLGWAIETDCNVLRIPTSSHLTLPLPSLSLTPISSSTDASASTSDDDPSNTTDSGPSSTIPQTSASSALPSSSSIASRPSSPPQITPKPSSSNVVSTDFTSTFTTTSKGVVITMTTVIKPSGSLAPTPESKGFFRNKTQEGIVFTVVILGVVLFSFLGYRFYKTVKKRQQHSLVEEARSAGRHRARIDDEDVDFSSSGIVQVAPLSPVNTHFNSETDMGIREGLRSSQDTLHRRMTSTDRSHSSFTDLGHRSSTDTELLFTGIKRSNTIRSDSMTLHRSPTAATTRSKRYYLSQEPLPPPLTLPDSFGDDVRPRSPQSKALEDDEDYHAMTGRVLKVRSPLFLLHMAFSDNPFPISDRKRVICIMSN